MRPTTSTMLQQNNNNNYPCLSMSGSTQEMLQKCSRAALPFPSRLELGDLPLIRGLRAWALCSSSHRKPGGLLGSRQAPAAPHAGPGRSSSKPAGLYPSGEWGHGRYGLPLGLNARQAEVGALVTVATLKTSEGSGKTQTQCLFLQTEKGSCLYPTAKPGSGGTSSAGSSVVGGWLRGKTGAGGGDLSVGRRDTGPNPTAHTRANRVRVGSGRRWRKSGNAAGCERPGVIREKQQEDPGEVTEDERKEAQDKGALDNKRSPSPQQDKQEGACRPPRCCHSASPKASVQCRRRAQRRESQEEHEGGVRKQRQRNEEDGACELGPPSVVLAAPNPDLEPNPGQPSRNEELRGQNAHDEDDVSQPDTNSDVIKIHSGSDGPSETRTFNGVLKVRVVSDGKPAENPGKDIVVRVDEFSDSVEANRGFEREMQSTDDEEETRSIAQTPAAANADVSVSNCPDCISAALLPESSAPLEGGVCTAAPGSDQGERQIAEGEEEPDASDETNTVKLKKGFSQNEGNKPSASPLRTKCPSSFRRSCRSDCQTAEPERRPELGSDSVRTRLHPWNEAGVKLHGDSITAEQSTKAETHVSTKPEDEHWDGCRDEEEDGDGQTSISRVEATSANVTNDACADPFTSPAVSQANPAPPLPPLGSMATGLPRAVAAEEGEGNSERNGVTARDGGQEGTTRLRSELEEPGEGTRGSTVATEDGREEEEEEGDEDEFGVFMQAEGEPAWSEGSDASASVPCGSRESVAPGWADSWAAFPAEPSDGGLDAVGQWWPSGAAEEGRDGPSWLRVFAEAFPAPPASSSADPCDPCDPCDPGSVPTLTQLLRGRASLDQGLLDSFHDLNKMIGRRYDRAGSASLDLLLRTLRLERPPADPRLAWAASRRLSPGLPSASQRAHSAAAKRRLSYDYNRNLME